MSAMPERRQPIDIEEFERRLRAPEPVQPENDPLAELARLVAGQNRANEDPLASLFADHKPPQQGAGFAEPVYTPAPPVEAVAPPVVDPLGDFPDLSRMLRKGDYAEPAVAPAVEFAPAADHAGPDAYRPSSEYEDWASADQSIQPDLPPPPPPKQRSRKPLYAAAAVIAAGFVAIGGTLAFRGGASNTAGTGGVATIKAAQGPIKVQPERTESESAPRESSMLDKAAPSPVKKVVTRDEQPMDVNSAAKTPRVIPMADATGATQPGAGSVSAPPAPVRAPTQAASPFPEPKKVKTVAVRADGSIISTETAPQPPQRPAAAAPAQTPAKNATPKNDAPKTAARAAPATTPAQPKAAAPAQPKPAAAAKPKQVAAIAPAKNDDDDAADDAPAKPTASTGSYSLQLAAPGSEAEARQVAQRLGAKFSDALGGRRPSVQKAADKAVYRVRVTGLSKEGAIAACEKVKAAGGACFIAR